jgi:dTDP-L-rhamnose 4-epimerase
LEKNSLHGQVFNIGSGKKYSINEIAQKIGYYLNKSHIAPIKSGKYRAGDIRHCFADISKAGKYLSYTPEIDIDKGIKELVPWLETQIAVDNVDYATSELIERGLSL